MTIEVKVDLTREEVSSFHRQIMKAHTPDGSWHFSVGFSDNQIAEMESYIKGKLDTREFKDSTKCYPYVEHRIWNKMKTEPRKAGPFDPTELSVLPDVIEAFRGKLCDLMGIAGYRPKQQILTETPKQTPVKPKK